MQPLTTAAMIERLFGKGGRRSAPVLPRSTVQHDSVDEMQFGNYADDSPRFKRMAIENAPKIAPDRPDPDPIDFTQATPEEIAAWQKEAKAAKAARDNAAPYDGWKDLTQDIFYSYHHPREPGVLAPEQVDPAVAVHSKIASKMMAEDDHAQARNMTRDQPTAAAIATMAAVRALRETLENELVDQARQGEAFEREREQAEAAMSSLQDMRQEAAQQHQQQGQVDPQLVEAIKQGVQAKKAAQAKAAQTALNSPMPFSKAAHDAVIAAAAAGKEAAKNAANIPSFGAGFGEGEPVYESPEQALTIADMWANNPILRQVAALYGRMDQDMRFQRAKRVVGGADEIVDLKFGGIEEIRRILPSELAALADEDMEDDFYMRVLGNEVRVYDTVGEEHAGRGPIIVVGDESGTMSGQRNVWLKAISLCLLNIARREKRDFAYVGFSGGTSVYDKQFPAKKAMDAQAVVDMASHFFGGGTTPIVGVTRAVDIMDRSDDFKKADLVIVGDGQASFGDEDKRLRDYLRQRGVRIHGIGIGGTFAYLNDYCFEGVVSVHDFDLENPSEATAHLATHVT